MRDIHLSIEWAFVLLVSLQLAQAQPPAEEKTKKLAEAEAKAEALLCEGKFAEAIEPATECARLSKDVNGAGNWRTFEAEHRLKLAETGKGLGADKQKKLVAAFAAETKSRALENDKAKEALENARSALYGFRDVLGEETVEAARAWHLIGQIVDNWKEAKEANTCALKIRRKVLPADHPDIGRSLKNLGLAQSNLGDASGAIKSYKAAIEVWKAGLGENDLLVAKGWSNLGDVQYDLKEFEALRQRWARQIRDTRDSATAELLRNLAAVDRELLGSALPTHPGAKDQFDPKRMSRLQEQRDRIGAGSTGPK